ncbi:MAG: hypothetical protein ABFS18_00455 [Thermodesulfobacteriota bacterium]
MASRQSWITMKRCHLPCCLTVIVALFLTMSVGQAQARRLTPLRLSPAPALNAEKCEQHGAQPVRAAARGGQRRQQGQRPAQESEHRPQPVRTYYFNGHQRLAQIEAFVRRPDGSIIQPTLQLGVKPNLSFPTPFGEGPGHGANNVYLLEQGVEDHVLVVRSAQWLTMHHSCGWGHDHKFDMERTQPQALNTLPLEIIIADLWDSNFHAKVTSGQMLTITALSYGKPLIGAKVQLQTAEKWVKEVVTDKNGSASLQLIRDYYPTKWSDFKRTKRGKFLVTAFYEAEEQGVFKDMEYERVRYITTLPWHYSPARADYSSYGLGLMIGLLGFTFTGGGIYFYRERRKKPYRGISLDE